MFGIQCDHNKVFHQSQSGVLVKICLALQTVGSKIGLTTFDASLLAVLKALYSLK